VDAFGNALGTSIAEYDWGGTARRAMSYIPEEQAQDLPRENSSFAVALADRASDSGNLADAQSYLSRNPMASIDISDPWQWQSQSMPDRTLRQTIRPMLRLLLMTPQDSSRRNATTLRGLITNQCVNMRKILNLM
jgi:hypothetical protein